MLFLYNILGWLLTALSYPLLLIYSSITGSRRRQELRQRLGIYSPRRDTDEGNKRIWLHAASVGEVKAAEILLGELKNRFPNATFTVTVVTRQGRDVAIRAMADRATILFAPLDLPLAVRRAVRQIAPTVYICLETELWPGLLAALDTTGVPLVLANGRMSERSHRRYSTAKWLIRTLLERFSLLAVISETDAERYRSLGAPSDLVHVIGNVKYDSGQLNTDAHANDYRKRLGLAERQTTLVCGSTHSGEEELLIDTWRRVKRRLPGLVWIVAPRHLRRLEDIKKTFTEHGLNFQLLTEIERHERHADIIVVDTMGDLASLYGIATYIFCGGSLVQRGGHNIMEAAIWGRPVLYGPQMKDFEDARHLLEEAGASVTVTSAAELAAQIIFFADHPDDYTRAGITARTIALAQQGSARRHAELIGRVVDADGREAKNHNPDGVAGSL